MLTPVPGTTLKGSAPQQPRQLWGSTSDVPLNVVEHRKRPRSSVHCRYADAWRDWPRAVDKRILEQGEICIIGVSGKPPRELDEMMGLRTDANAIRLQLSRYLGSVAVHSRRHWRDLDAYRGDHGGRTGHWRPRCGRPRLRAVLAAHAAG